MSQPRVVSAVSTNEFMASTAAQTRSELVRGAVRALPPNTGARKRVCENVARVLGAWGEKHKAGRAFDGNTPFELPNIPNTVRAPDVSFVRVDHLPLGGHGGGWLSVCPDIAVEVLSEKANASDLDERLADYLAAGTPLVWLVNVRERRVAVYSPKAPVRWHDSRDALDGGDVLPKFRCKVSDLFEGVTGDAAG